MDVTSSHMCNLYTDVILRHLKDYPGVNVQGHNLTDIQCDDDKVLIATIVQGFPDAVPSRGGQCYHKSNGTPTGGRGHDNARSRAKDPFWEGCGSELTEPSTSFNNQWACSVCRVAEMPGRYAVIGKPTSG